MIAYTCIPFRKIIFAIRNEPKLPTDQGYFGLRLAATDTDSSGKTSNNSYSDSCIAHVPAITRRESPETMWVDHLYANIAASCSKEENMWRRSFKMPFAKGKSPSRRPSVCSDTSRISSLTHLSALRTSGSPTNCFHTMLTMSCYTHGTGQYSTFGGARSLVRSCPYSERNPICLI